MFHIVSTKTTYTTVFVTLDANSCREYYFHACKPEMRLTTTPAIIRRVGSHATSMLYARKALPDCSCATIRNVNFQPVSRYAYPRSRCQNRFFKVASAKYIHVVLSSCKLSLADLLVLQHTGRSTENRLLGVASEQPPPNLHVSIQYHQQLHAVTRRHGFKFGRNAHPRLYY